MPRNPKCRDCGLWKSSANVCVWGDGPTDSEVVVIGEAPGENEARTGKPFTGRSGQLLRSELKEAGIRSVYITNIVKCRPPDNRTPTPDEIKACRKYLDQELAEIKPKYILTVGSPASKSVLKKAKITEAHGQIVDLPGGITGMPAYHPAYCLRDPSKLPAFRHDLARLRRVMDGEIGNSGDVKWKVVTSETLDWFIREFREAEEFAFDLETSGLFPHDLRGFIRCVGIGLKTRGWVIPMEMPGSPYSDGRWKAQKAMIKALVEMARGKWCTAWNGKFDNLWLKRYYGVSFHINFDAMLAHHVLDENQPHDLKYVSRAELDVPEYDLPTKEKKGNTTPMRLYEYNAKDCVYTLQLAQIFRQRLKKDFEVRRLFYKLVMPGARMLEEVELEGITLDMKKYAETENRVQGELTQTLKELNALVGKEINWNSTKQVSHLLFKELGLKSTVKTKTGAASTGEEALLALKGEHPVADKLIKYRELEKFMSTYIGKSEDRNKRKANGWKPFIVEDKLYLSYKVHGTVTGRYSSRLHQIPRDGTIRNLAIAPPGWTFLQGDFSQAELRIAAVLSGDLELLRCFKKGPDVHWRTLIHVIRAGVSGQYVRPAFKTGHELFKRQFPGGPRRRLLLTECLDIMEAAGHEACIETWDGWKEARKKAKAVNFGFVYGMYENKFIQTAKVKYGWEPTWDEAHETRGAYFSLYSGLPTWHGRTKRLVRMNGHVTSLSGRKRRLPGIFSTDKMVRSEAERQAINSPVQGFIGDYKVMAMIEIGEEIPKVDLRVCGEHHDALLMIVRNESIDRTLPKVKRIMESPKLLKTFNIDLPVKIEAELELGPWGKGKAWKE